MPLGFIKREPTSEPDLAAQACTASMNLSDEVDLEDYVSRPDKISNAEIAAICQVNKGAQSSDTRLPALHGARR